MTCENGSELMLDIIGMRFGYSTTDNLRDINVKLRPGEFVGLLGPNGSGKTTLMRCVNRILRIREGTIHIDGNDIMMIDMLDIAKLCTTVPADAPTNFSLTVKDFVTLGRTPYMNNWWWEDPEDDKVIEDAMAQFHITEYSERKLGQLSSGERARALLAKGVVQNPKLMMVDEPSAHLDIKYKIDVMEMLKELSRSGITVLMASHDINLVSRYCDRVILLHNNMIVGSGTPSETITESNIKRVYDANISIVRVDGTPYIIPRGIGEGPEFTIGDD